MRNAILKMQLDRGIAEIMGACAAANRYFDKLQPWTMAKNGDTAGLARVLRNTAEALRVISGLLYPIMPGKMTELRKAIGMDGDEVVPVMDNLYQWNLLRDGADVLSLDQPIFPRINPKKEDEPAQGKKK
jgi:methionyl-tRNA synthetase